MQEWRFIDGYNDFYIVSSDGIVRSLDREILINGNKTKISGKVVKSYINNKGYEIVRLNNNGQKSFCVHRLVALAFIENPNGYNQVNHIDGNKLNNSVENLEWSNQRLNYDHGMSMFLYSKNENHFFSKLTNEKVSIIPDLYRLGFIRATVAKILDINHSSLEAIENKISYRELNLDFNFKRTKYKDLDNIKIPKNIYLILKDNIVLNTLIAQGKVLV